MRGVFCPLGMARLPPSPPEGSTAVRLSRSFALPLWPTSRAPVPRRLPAAPPLPHGRGSWLTARGVGRHCPAARVETKGAFTPHPKPRSPSRGEGCHVRFPLQLKTQIPPLAPNGGEGSGVRGQLHPKHPQPPAILFRVFRVFRGAPRPQPQALTALKPSRRETQKHRTRAKSRVTMTSHSFVPIRVHSWFKTAPAPRDRRYPPCSTSSSRVLPQECSAIAESDGPRGGVQGI